MCRSAAMYLKPARNNMDTIERLLDGDYHDQQTGESFTMPTRRVLIERSLVGMEHEAIASLGLKAPIAIVSDPRTYDVMGQRIEQVLQPLGEIIPVHLPEQPHADMETAQHVARETSAANAIVAVGSGTINDLCKYAAAQHGIECAVFATAPSMNGYTSVNAAITMDGHKKSLATVAPVGVFMDLEVLSNAPRDMIRSGLGDSVCRSTAQADWLLSHHLHNETYRDAPFDFLAFDEPELLSHAEALIHCDSQAMLHLARTLVLSGMGMTVCGGSYPASQGEHLISHYIEMMAPADWHRAFHGEQIAVTTLVMARLQERILSNGPPRILPSKMTRDEMCRHFGEDLGAACWTEIAPKLPDAERAEILTQHLYDNWNSITDAICENMVPAAEIESALRSAGAPISYRDIGLQRDFIHSAILHARLIRNRYTFLDLAADSGQLDPDQLM